MGEYIFIYLIAAPIFLSWLIIKVLREIREIFKKYDNLERLLLDIRDNKKTFFQERRRAVRLQREMDAKLVNARTEENMKILNIGYGGALLRASHNFKMGDAIEMKAYLPLYAQPIDIGAKVVRVNRFNTENRPAMVDAGVEFRRIGSLDEQKLAETIDVLTARA